MSMARPPIDPVAYVICREPKADVECVYGPQKCPRCGLKNDFGKRCRRCGK